MFLGLDDWLIKALSQLAICEPTPVQQATIPSILQGHDVIASAKTGSGKTAAFALPILQQLSKDPYGIFALVLTPTRELAFQIAEQFNAMGSGISLKINVCVGGLDMLKQAVELAKRPHIIIATPGRLADHISSSDVKLDKIKFLVLDEADRLLDETFKPDLKVILNHLPKSKQTLLFSATMTEEIKQLKFNPDRKPFVYQGNTQYDTVEKLDQKYLFIPYIVKDVYLAYLLKNKWNDSSVIIFTNKWKTCERLYLMLRELGVRCTPLHSRLSQRDRLASIAKFKSNIVTILLTTDVGSRGLDIPTVQTVVNYDLPADPTDYIHRIGRTARAGRGGLAVSLVCQRDVELLLHIEEKIEKKLEEYSVSEQQALDMMKDVSMARRMANMTFVDESKSRFAHKLRKFKN